MLAQHAAGIFAGGARLGAEAWGERGEAQRQRVLVENLLAHEISQRHLGRRDQPKSFARAEHILGRLRQIAGAVRHLLAHQYWRCDFGIAVLARVHVEHELAQSAFEPRQSILEYDETRARELRSSLEVHLAKRFTEFEMFSGCEAVITLGAEAMVFDVVV